MPSEQRHLQSGGLGPKSLDLHSKLTWLILQATQMRYLVPQGTATTLRQLLRSFYNLS
jgi:hypothetical protein